MSAAEAVLVEMLRQVTRQPGLAVARADVLADIAELDSLRLLEAVALAELRLGVAVDTARLDRLATVGDVIDALRDAPPCR